MDSKTFKQENVGCHLLETGKVKSLKPGTKPALLPVWDRDLCSRCALCYLYCPDAAISKQDDGFLMQTFNYARDAAYVTGNAGLAQ